MLNCCPCYVVYFQLCVMYYKRRQRGTEAKGSDAWRIELTSMREGERRKEGGWEWGEREGEREREISSKL